MISVTFMVCTCNDMEAYIGASIIYSFQKYKRAKSMQFSMSVSESGIRSDFLNPLNYKQTLQFASKRNENYLKFCRIIQKYYADLHQMTKISGEHIKLLPGNGLKTINQLKQFMVDFMGIIDEVAKFKMQFYQELEDVEEDPVKKPTYQIMAKIEKYAIAQNSFKEIQLKIKTIEKQLEDLYAQLKKDTKEPVKYFDQKNTINKCTQIEQLIVKREELIKEGNDVLGHIFKNSEEFERDLMFYRQRMLSGKYKIHQKLIQMASGAKECLVQTLLSLLDLVGERQRQFQVLLSQGMKQSTLKSKAMRRPQGSNSQNFKLTEIIIQATQEYKGMIDDLMQVLKAISECFLAVGNKTKENHQNGRPVIEQINKLYQTYENPTPQIMQALDLCYFFCQKLADIPNHIHILQTNLIKLRQNISKHSQITLSLVRCGNATKSSSKGQEGQNINQIGHLFDQLSYDYINDIIRKLYREFQTTLGNMKNHFNAKFYKKRKNVVQDSMEISHIEEHPALQQKRPSKKQMWIWKDYRNSQKYHKKNVQSQAVRQIMKGLKNFKEMKGDKGKQIQKYTCSLRTRKEVKGQLCIYQKALGFTAANNSLDLVIPYDFIEQVVAGVNIFERQLAIKTSIGNVMFLHFPQISRAQVLIQQQITAQAGTKQNVQKASVQLSEEEKAFLAERRPKIEAERESIQGMEEMGSVLLENVSIDAVYDVVYSDKPFKYRGKQQVCYMSYVLKKSGGFNYKTTPYSPPGPKFYTNNEESTFINTPLFSTRTNDYQVPLPPIPFMPKTCNTTQQVKIYWISNIQLDYTFRIDSRGAPMSDGFYLNFIHRIAQKDKNVQINIYYKITFVKDSMKGMITSKSEEQSKNNVGIFLAETKKVMKSGGGGNTGGTAGGAPGQAVDMEMEQQAQASRVMAKGKVAKLQNQNKILIGVLVGVIVINIILRFI